ncbi:Uncharacterised protein g10010 [Pycnogonum litorale]
MFLVRILLICLLIISLTAMPPKSGNGTEIKRKTNPMAKFICRLLKQEKAREMCEKNKKQQQSLETASVN